MTQGKNEGESRLTGSKLLKSSNVTDVQFPELSIGCSRPYPPAGLVVRPQAEVVMWNIFEKFKLLANPTPETRMMRKK